MSVMNKLTSRLAVKLGVASAVVGIVGLAGAAAAQAEPSYTPSPKAAVQRFLVDEDQGHFLAAWRHFDANEHQLLGSESNWENGVYADQGNLDWRLHRSGGTDVIVDLVTLQPYSVASYDYSLVWNGNTWLIDDVSALGSSDSSQTQDQVSPPATAPQDSAPQATAPQAAAPPAANCDTSQFQTDSSNGATYIQDAASAGTDGDLTSFEDYLTAASGSFQSASADVQQLDADGCQVSDCDVNSNVENELGDLSYYLSAASDAINNGDESSALGDLDSAQSELSSLDNSFCNA